VSQLDQAGSSESSAAVRQRVTAAREFRQARTQGETGPPGQAFEDRWLLTPDARRLLRRAFVQDGLSGRAFARIAGLARTIADLDQTEPVGPDHVAEALAFRLDYRRIGFS
jgi:magnesium chelatase family protein